MLILIIDYLRFAESLGNVLITGPGLRGTTRAERHSFERARLQQCQTNPNQDLGIRDRGIAVPVCRSQVMTGCLLVGASYALLNTQTHAVGAVAAVGVQDSKVRASMDTRNRGGSFWKQASPGVGVQRQRPHTLFIHRNPSRKELFLRLSLIGALCCVLTRRLWTWSSRWRTWSAGCRRWRRAWSTCRRC